MSHNVKHEQNSGFSLIELLIAIAILAMLTVPLMNLFIMSGTATAAGFRMLPLLHRVLRRLRSIRRTRRHLRRHLKNFRVCMIFRLILR